VDYKTFAAAPALTADMRLAGINCAPNEVDYLLKPRISAGNPGRFEGCRLVEASTLLVPQQLNVRDT
jgi:hypothetical protein